MHAESACARNARDPRVRPACVRPAGWAAAEDLPADAIAHICGYLPAADVAAMQRVSRNWQASTTAVALWTQLLQRDFAQQPSVAGGHADRHLLPSSGLIALRDEQATAGAASASGSALSDLRPHSSQNHPKREYADMFVHQVQVLSAVSRARPLSACVDAANFPVGLGVSTLLAACFPLRECARRVTRLPLYRHAAMMWPCHLPEPLLCGVQC